MNISLDRDQSVLGIWMIMSKGESTKMPIFGFYGNKHEKLKNKLSFRVISKLIIVLSTSHDLRLRLHTNYHQIYLSRSNAYNSGDANDFYRTEGLR